MILVTDYTTYNDVRPDTYVPKPPNTTRGMLKDLTQERVRELFDYDPITGIMTRKTTVNSKKAKAGQQLNFSTNSAGYYRVQIDKIRYLLHRVIWLWMEGYMPEAQVDHINRQITDNRWCNLRVLEQSCNMRNTGVRDTSSSGIKGISFINSRKTWDCQVNIYDPAKGKTRSRHIGQFKDLIEAAAHRLAVEQCLGIDTLDYNSSASRAMKEYLTRDEV